MHIRCCIRFSLPSPPLPPVSSHARALASHGVAHAFGNINAERHQQNERSQSFRTRRMRRTLDIPPPTAHARAPPRTPRAQTRWQPERHDKHRARALFERGDDSTARTCRACGPPEKPGGVHARIAFGRCARKPGPLLIDKVSMALKTRSVLFRPFCSNSENRYLVRKKSGNGDDGPILNVSTWRFRSRNSGFKPVLPS